jgi:hypothetical protein
MSVTNKTIRDLENAAMEAVQAMNELTELLEGGRSVFLRDQRIANRVERLRIASAELDRAETACSRERTLTMSEEDMREEFAVLDLDWDETTERGQAHLQKLLAEYDADKIRVGASVDDGRPRSGFKIPDAPAEPQPRRTVLDIPPDPSGEAVVRLDLPLGHQPGGLGDGGKSDRETWLATCGDLWRSALDPRLANYDGLERSKRIAEARALLKANGWVESEPGMWSPAPHLGWAIDLNRELRLRNGPTCTNSPVCSPSILRALAILAEEVQS